MSARKKQEIRETIQDRDRISVLLYILYGFFLIVSLVIIVRIIHIQISFDIPQGTEAFFRPRNIKVTEEPARGAIIASDGRLLALTTPMYQVYMDCTVQKDNYAADKNGAEKEAEWQKKARELANGLSRVYGTMSGEQFAKLILDGRRDGKRYVPIGGHIDHETLQEVKNLPLFSEGRYRSGMIIEKIDTRQYPYGDLARRTIGYVKDNSRSNGNNRVGLEGQFDYALHGQEGTEWLRVTDNGQRVRNYDSTYVRAENGLDVRTTLNIDFQDIADKAIRRQIEEDQLIQGACVIIMDVKTGAILSMVNLQRDTLPGSPLTERINLAISQVAEQGSVFKTVTLMSLLEDGYVKSLEQTIPTNRGIVPGGLFRPDSHITSYEYNTGRKDITVRHGFEISSNYVFTYLATQYYGSHPKDFYDKIYSYKLGEVFDFDLKGLGTPQVIGPTHPGWSKTTLGTAAYGYSISVTPLHVATFYNAIANKGKMMRPYLVESIEKQGVVKKKYGPSLLNSICSRATADTLTRALMAVTEDGTARLALRNVKLPVAGKTGTAQVALSASDKPRKGDAYHDASGRMKNQGTFVGFFPADAPKYTILVSVYSKLSHQSFYGGTYPARAVKEIVDNIYALDSQWGERIPKHGSMPTMKLADNAAPGDGETVPDLRGLGLKDALYLTESSGYKCSYSGSGHVSAQTPAPGTKLKGGETVTLTLK